tara:strand:+ start:1520 stop:1873 length:354 start_codon:yes stop_codon:yes gene_type:complete
MFYIKIIFLPIFFLSQPILSNSKCGVQTLTPVIKVSEKCPQGYRSSGGYCIPISENVNPLIPIFDGKKVLNCPLGYKKTRGYCQSVNSIKRNSLPKIGEKCPSNYYKNKNFCIEICN